MVTSNNMYFASANTTSGFMSFFPQIFDPNRYEKIFILKGGPGTGKSSFLRAIGEKALENKMEVEFFLCSSDPNSLDGIIVHDLSLVVLDGTSPHLSDPIYPGAVENILNLGEFWDGKKLYESKKEIMEWIREKKRYYNRAYRFLKAYGEIEGEIGRIGEKALLEDKMKKSLSRIADRYFTKKENPDMSIRLVETVGGQGIVKLDSFIQKSENVFIIEDCVHASRFYFDSLYDFALASGQKFTVSFSYLFPDKINAIFFPEEKISFVIGKRDYESEDQNKTYHYINMKRFLDLDLIRENKQKIRFGARCSDMLLSGATEAFWEAKSAHANLERKYIEAMDFTELNRFREDFLKSLFL